MVAYHFVAHLVIHHMSRKSLVVIATLSVDMLYVLLFSKILLLLTCHKVQLDPLVGGSLQQRFKTKEISKLSNRTRGK